MISHPWRFRPCERAGECALFSNTVRAFPAFRIQLASHGSYQPSPVVIGDALFATTAGDTFSIDPVNCKIKWRHSYRRSQEPMLQINRGVAYFNGRVFRGTDDARLVALDAETGKEAWTSVVGDPGLGEYVSAAPLAWNGLVIAGIAGSEFGARGRIIAYSALDGRVVWRFDTVPVGDQFGADTWGDSDWAQHGGGGIWSTFTLDPTTAELFAPVGNPVPDFAPNERRGDNLFTNSALVLDAPSGGVLWNGPALDPRRMTLFVGALDFCMVLKAKPGQKYEPRGINMGGTYVIDRTQKPAGWLTAVDAETGAVRWKYRSDSPMLGGVTTTAGGVVLTGDNGGNFLVFDSTSGKLLLKEPVNGAVGGGVVTYERGGTQYVALASGNMSYASAGLVGRPSIVLFALPEDVRASADPSAVQISRGKLLYSQMCGVCHGPAGDKIPGKDLKTVRARMDGAQLDALLHNPTGAMPKVFNEPLSEENERDIRDTVTFLLRAAF